MQVLFVCVANVGRSQMAEAFYNRLSMHTATSAGSQVGDREGQTLKERAREAEACTTPGNMLRIMKEEEGLDLSRKLRCQLTPELVDHADRVVVMCRTDPYPNYLRDNPRVTFWDIQDLFGTPYEAVRQLKDEVKAHVARMVAETG
jgi:arsenate reductase (thioredoxin)